MLQLLRQRNFSLLWFGGLISFIGDWMTLIALPIYIYNLTGSVLATGLMWMSAMLPSVILGSVAGVYVDRWDRRVTMVAANLLTAPLMLVLLVVESPDQVWIIYVVAILKSTIGNFMGPAENALLPKLVGEEHLTVANALNTLNNTLSRLIGPAIGGAVFAYLGFSYSVFLDAVTFLVAGVMIGLINAPRSVTRAEVGETPGEARPHVWRELMDGLRLVGGNRLILSLFFFMSVAMLAEGFFEVLVIPYIQDVLKGGSQELGWLFTTQAVGGLLGGLLIGRLGKRVNPANLIGAGIFVLGLMTVAIFNVPIFSLDLLFFLAVGPAVVGLQTGTQTLLQLNVEDRYRGRVFGSFGTIVSLAILTGQLVASLAGGTTGPIPLMTAGGILTMATGVVAFVMLARMLNIRASQTQPTLKIEES
jgi:MFS family permease